jgi:release factor glutamine methyltransferase
MNIAEAERFTREKLGQIYDKGEAANIAGLLLEHVTSLAKAERILKMNAPLSETQQRQMDNYLQRLLRQEPLQYVTNKAWFYGLELYVDPAVLIPRPETEELVDWVLKDVHAARSDVFERGQSQSDETSSMKILDVGTGSGCIALALKKSIPKAEVWGCDVSEEALNIARRNGSALDIRVDFQGVDFLNEDQQKSIPTVDIVVSNPPYVPYRDKDTMAANVVEHEPHKALFVPDEDPFIFYKALARFGKQRLRKNGKLYMEIHESLGKDVVLLFQQEGYKAIELRKDMQAKDRMVKIESPAS